MKLTANKSAGFIERPDKSCRVFLLYGPDAGLVKERGVLLAKHFVADLHDPFAIADLTADQLKEDPARLHDEMATIPMLGGTRLVRVQQGSDAAFAALDHLLGHLPAGDSVCILEGGELDKRSKLRARVEDDAMAMAIPCYAEEGASLDKTILAIIKEQGLSLEGDALQRAHAVLPQDRAALRHELEKLAIYAWRNPARRITLADVEACIADGHESDMDEAIHAACAGDGLKLDRQLTRLAAEGINAVQILRGCQRHVLRLYEAIGIMQQDGLSADDALERLRPPVFFKQKPAMMVQLRRWNAGLVAHALAMLLEAEKRVKSAGMPADLIGQRALQALSRTGGGR